MRIHILIGIVLSLFVVALSGCSDVGGGNSVEPFGYELNIDLDESNIVVDTNAISSTPPRQFRGLFVSRVLYESDRENTQRSLKLSSRTVSRDPLTVLYDISEDAELWLMPTERRSSHEISFENTWNIKKYSAQEDGSYLIPYEDLPGDERDSCL